MNKKAIPAIFFPILMGSLALINALNRPRLANIHSVDVVTLLAAGACFGVAFMALIMMLKKKF